MAKLRITYNAPVILTFALAATIVQLIGDSARQYCMASPDLDGWRSYLGLFSHILGHANWDHLLGNFAVILLVGPILEERHGSLSILAMIAVTALITGLANTVLSDTYLLGASGIVFMFVILASMANIKSGEIPLTFIAVAVLYLGREVVNAFRDDQVSQMGHLIGGVAGAAFGFLSARRIPASKPVQPVLPAVPRPTATPSPAPAARPAKK